MHFLVHYIYEVGHLINRATGLIFCFLQVWTKMIKLEMWEVEISTYTKMAEEIGLIPRMKNLMPIQVVVKLHWAVEDNHPVPVPLPGLDYCHQEAG
jgi:hypothetical protein